MGQALTKGEILAALPGLGAAGLAEIMGACQHLLGAQNAPMTATSPLYDAVTGLLASKVSFAQFRQTGAHAHWEKNNPTVVEFILTAFPEAAGNKVLGLAISRLLMEMLIEDLRKRHIPVSLGTVATHLSRVPEVFESNFPGYIKSGLTYLLVKAMERGT